MEHEEKLEYFQHYATIRGGSDTIDGALGNLEDVVAQIPLGKDELLEFVGSVCVVFDPQEQRWHAIQAYCITGWRECLTA